MGLIAVKSMAIAMMVPLDVIVLLLYMPSGGLFHEACLK